MSNVICLFADDRLVTGSVVEASDNTPIVGANILIKDIDGKIIAYGISATDGGFSIKILSEKDNLSINASMLGYKPYSAPLAFDGRPIVIKMQEGVKQLKDVIIKAERIRESGDTITYTVDSFAQKQDKSIGDVLKRMPGIEVSNNGKIQYQGTDINKFYIEGNDLLGGKYGIATNGISYDDIGSVSVMENHEPMQVLRGLTFSDQAAINLNMKNSAKATFLIHGTLAGGWSEQPKGMLWLGDIFTMMITRKYQMITTFKGNNSGTNLSEQLIDFTSEKSEEKINGYISLSTPFTPNLQRSRSYFNNSWMVSSSHLLKTDKGGEFKAQIDYYNDRISAQAENSTTYFLASGDKIIFEDKNSLSHRNAVTGKFSYEANEKSYFLNNTISTDLSWNDLTLNTLGTLPNTQYALMPEYSVSNHLKVIKRFANNKLITFTSRNEWNSLPEKLTVTQYNQNYSQKINQHAFYTNEYASLGFVFDKVMLSFDAGVSGFIRRLNTDLFGMDKDGLDTSEALTTDYFGVFASPKLEWTYKKLELVFRLPVNMYSYFFSGNIRNRTEFFMSPSLSARFKITPRLSLNLNANARRSPASLHNIHNSSILTDYRSFSSGIDDYYTSSGQSISASCHYKNIPIGMFLIAMGRYGWNKSKFGSVQNLMGDYIFYSYRSQPTDSRNAMAFFNVNKTINFMRGSIGLRANYQRVETSLMSQGLDTDYCNDFFSLSPSINGNISRYINWRLQFIWDKSLLKIANMSRQSSENFIYSGNLTITPSSFITWTFGGEFYHNQIQEGRYKDMFMLDSKLTFNINKRVEISLSANNLLNNHEYRYTSYNALSRYERSSKLRGREFMISLYLKK